MGPLGRLGPDVADGVQQPVGGPVDFGYQFGGKSRGGLGHVGRRWNGVGRHFFFFRFSGSGGRCFRRCRVGHGGDSFSFHADTQQRHAVDCRHHDGLRASSAISLLNFFATAEGVHSYMVWGMGNFGGVSLEQLPWFAAFTSVGLLMSVLLIKPLNALLLGERYAENLGVNVRRTRSMLLVVTGILTAVVTAFCGPVSFIGLAVPHVARLLLGTSNHNALLPVTLLSGGAVALLCNLICILPGEEGLLP